MTNPIFTKLFWFTFPSFSLIAADRVLMWIFAALLAIGVIAPVVNLWNKDLLWKNVIKRFRNLGLTIGLLGLFWFALRYENTPLFALRYWAGLILAIGVVWLGFIVKYLIFDFAKDRKAVANKQIKEKYLPKSR
jgi:hypothetical protein